MTDNIEFENFLYILVYMPELVDRYLEIKYANQATRKI